MTRYWVTASLGDDVAAVAPMIVIDGRGSLVGAEIVPLEYQSLGEAILGFEALTDRPLLVRRTSGGRVFPQTLEESGLLQDIGARRKSLITFQPGKGCLPAALGRFLRMCRDAGLVVDVALWPEMHRFMPPIQYKVLCEMYVPVIRKYGYTHTFTVSNYAAVMEDAAEAYWPGGEYVDNVSVIFYPSGLSLNRVSEFAADHGKPFGIAELGIDVDSVSIRDGIAFLEYVRDFFLWRQEQDLPCTDIVWMSGIRDGDYRLSRAWEFTAAYQQMFDTLIT